MNDGTETGWKKLAAAVPDGDQGPVAASVDGEPILLFKVGEGWRGVQRECPHQRGTLTTANVVGNGSMIRCAFHAYTFKLSNGTGVNCRGYAISVYDVEVRNNEFFVRKANG
ncbi:MAG: Rieske (2Fe-2S) protein [Hyphomicrobiaceae bacterium]